MTKLRRNLMALALCSATLFALSDPTPAQDAFPSRTVRFVVGFPPGGGVDAVARLFAEKLSVIFGQPVVVMNHPGAAGGIAGKQVSADPPDGYTVLVNSNSMVVYSLMNPKTDLVVERDVLIELKAVERLLYIHQAQVVTYLRLARLPIGLLVNFNVLLLRDGLRRLTPNRPNPSRSPDLPVQSPSGDLGEPPDRSV